MDLSLPCRDAVCHKPLKRPHLHCLTCPERRYHYNKGNAREIFIPLKPKQQVWVMNVMSPAVFPKNVLVYNLPINLEANFFKRVIKHVFLKPLLSVAEVIANW